MNFDGIIGEVQVLSLWKSDFTRCWVRRSTVKVGVQRGQHARRDQGEIIGRIRGWNKIHRRGEAVQVIADVHEAAAVHSVCFKNVDKSVAICVGTGSRTIVSGVEVHRVLDAWVETVGVHVSADALTVDNDHCGTGDGTAAFADTRIDRRQCRGEDFTRSSRRAARWRR